MGIIQEKCLIKVRIGFSNETFAYMVLVTFWPSKIYKFPKVTKLPKVPKKKKSNEKISFDGCLYLGVLTLGQKCCVSDCRQKD